MAPPPSAEELAALDAKIDASPDVSDADRASRRELLRRMFCLGERLRAAGVGEDWLRARLPAEAVLVTSWAAVDAREAVLARLWKRDK